jgi:FtsZ-binding cell division protein ZapB
MNKFLPWLVSVALAIALVAVTVHYNGVVAAKDAELQALNEKNSSLSTQVSLQLKAADDKINAVNEKLQQVASEARTRIQALAAEANEKLQATNQPEPTVLVSFRKAFFGSGSVAMIKNSSSQSISISLVAERSSTNQRRPFEITIDGGQVKEIGEREGWAFLNGDALKVSQPGHKPLSFSFR